MAEMLTAGSERWWAEKKGPQWQPEGDGYRVTFWWRDPAGTEQTSAIRRVWIYITGVTDHHQTATPQTLARLPGTDVWQWQTVLPAHWRGTYCFIPSERDDDFSPDVFSGTPERNALRDGWRKLLPLAIADPRNPQGWTGGRGHAVSVLEMPDAPVQPGWDLPSPAYTPPVQLAWRSPILHNTRRVWVFTTGNDNDVTRPLAILLDGQFWAKSQPVWPALAALTQRGELPPAVYVLIDALDTATRGRELPCNADFWQAVQQELLSQVRTVVPFSDDPERTVVAGQSFGGLAAMYAGLHWPQRFGCVLSQSGSFWWPHRDGQQAGAIPEQLRRGEVSPHSLRIWLEAGEREPVIFRASQALLAQLQATAQQVLWRPVDGGHDALCWRGGLTAGLIALWQPMLTTGR
ncbi:enterobactin esterase [Trabulsiella guamensis ATCC 49490]|uniref:Enterobactin esterase n=1 Tax=Trabulsiella guamensis ATCC 49490 TaxID=1005994 RepID=A0A085A0S7_9ENTR|nr:enterochelin esterase [Trabulsiella guamensis]KFC03822.1 enterobactin esterase [Trabulsiella guamensis ATCC 49490]